MQIYRDNGTQFVLLQTVSVAATRVEAIAITDDSKFLAVGSFDSNVRVYNFASGTLTLNQTISESFAIYEVAISQQYLAYSGSSNRITFLKRNGSSYELEQTVITN